MYIVHNELDHGTVIGAIKELRKLLVDNNVQSTWPLLKVAKNFYEEEAKFAVLYGSSRYSDSQYLQQMKDWMNRKGIMMFTSTSSLEEPSEKLQEETEEILAWRWFRVIDGEIVPPMRNNKVSYKLYGVNVDPQPEPDFGNPFGFWSFRTKKRVEEYVPVSKWSFGYSDVQDLFAVVRVTGVVMEHDFGYRSSEIEIMGLYSRAKNSTRRGLAHRFGWPEIKRLEEGKNEYPIRKG